MSYLDFSPFMGIDDAPAFVQRLGLDLIDAQEWGEGTSYSIFCVRCKPGIWYLCILDPFEEVMTMIDVYDNDFSRTFIQSVANVLRNGNSLDCLFGRKFASFALSREEMQRLSGIFATGPK